MKTILLSFLLLATAGFTFKGDEPKITKDDNTIFVDGKPYFKYKWEKMTSGLDIEKMDGTKLCFMRREDYYDGSKLSSSNPKGTVTYYSLIREGSSDVSCELQYVTAKSVAKIFLEYNVLDENGNINEENFQRLASRTGSRYSQNRPVNINMR